LAKAPGGGDRVFWIRQQMVPKVVAIAREIVLRGMLWAARD